VHIHDNLPDALFASPNGPAAAAATIEPDTIVTALLEQILSAPAAHHHPTFGKAGHINV
jgi:hypothetical protein